MIRYHARWVLPVSAAPIADGTVVVDGATIAWVGPRGDAPPGKDVDLGDAVLAPGLVNAHCHLELTVMRGFLEGLGFREWILRLTTGKRSVLTREDLLDSARLGVLEGIRSGVTTYADTCDSGVAFDAMLEAGVRGIMYQEVFGPDPRQRDASMAELRGKIERLRPRATGTVQVGISPHAPYTVSDELFAAVADYARSESLPVAVHIAESEAESDLVTRGDGAFADGLRRRGIDVRPRATSPIDLLRRSGLLDVRPLLIHAVRTDAGDVAAVKEADAAIAHCPVSNAKLGHGIAPLLAYLNAGIRVGLGSDSVASNNRMDLLAEAHAATLMQSAATRRADALTAHEALELATLGGARALGMADRIGSLEAGKDADLAAFALRGASALPVHDPEAALVHALHAGDAVLTVVAGVPLMNEGIVHRADPGVADRVAAGAARLGAWLARAMEAGGPVPPASDTR